MRANMRRVCCRLDDMSHSEGQVNQSSNISVSIRVIGSVGVLS